MGRRWVVQVDRGPNYANEVTSRYLGVAHHVGPDAGKLEAVTVSYAKRFVTKREALAAAKDAGFSPDTDPDVEAMRTWW